MPRITRRRLLCGVAASTGVGALSIAAGQRYRSESTTGTDGSSRRGFDPAVDGFGFDNYSTPPEPPEPTALLSEDDVRTLLVASGTGSVPGQLSAASDRLPQLPARTVAGRLHANANRLFGTKGYCYGMAAAAQWYFEEPAAVPVDRASASEITDVDDPLEDRSRSPVRSDIERFHRSQFLNPEAWAGRWVLLRPELIDYRAQARELRRALDSFGSAGVTVTGGNVVNGHYVLLYDYETTDDTVTFAAYDPNDDAGEYEGMDELHTIGVDTAAGEPLLGSYEGRYDRFLYGREDRTIRIRTAPDRGR